MGDGSSGLWFQAPFGWFFWCFCVPDGGYVFFCARLEFICFGWFVGFFAVFGGSSASVGPGPD